LIQDYFRLRNWRCTRPFCLSSMMSGIKTAYLRGLWFVNHVCRPAQGHRPAGFLYRSFPKSYGLRVDKKHFYVLRTKNNNQSGRCPLTAYGAREKKLPKISKFLKISAIVKPHGNQTQIRNSQPPMEWTGPITQAGIAQRLTKS